MVRCGNHEKRVHHDSVQAVRNCYATHFSRKTIVKNANSENDLPGWMTNGDPNYVRPAHDNSRPTPRGWWDLPIAAGMWRADAAQIEH